MNIDTYINNSIINKNKNYKYKYKYHYMDDINPTVEEITNIFIHEEINIIFDKNYKLLTGICYITEYIIDKMSLSNSNIFINPDNSLYIICDFNKNISDIITGTNCNYKISILYNNSEIPLQKYDIDEIALLNVITLPIFCMIFGSIKFKIYFNSINDFNSNEIKIKYISVTLSNESLKDFARTLKILKYVYNNKGYTFEDGCMYNKNYLD